MLRTNKDKLVSVGIEGQVWPPSLGAGSSLPDFDGKSVVMLGMGGIIYNVHVGDPACGYAAVDHVEPAVSIKHADDQADNAIAFMTCIGNEVVICSGLAKGAKGIIIGKHGRVMAEFPTSDLENIAIGDKVMIKTFGLGLQILDYPNILAKGCSPELLEAIPVREEGDGSISVPVAAELTDAVLGSGQEVPVEMVDYDLMTADQEMIKDMGLDKLKIGDLVGIRDADHRFGRSYRKGATTIGVIIHGDSIRGGHGPGVETLLTCKDNELSFYIDPKANIDTYLNIRERYNII